MKPLSPQEKTGRIVLIAVFLSAFACGWLVDPVRAGHWWPLPLSCNAALGVPCLFCGMTRALHLLLRGNLSGALYYNWLSFPLLLAVCALIALFLFELLAQKRILDFRAALHLTSRRLSLALLFVTVLWMTNVYLAVSQHKTELLNPSGPLYSLLVR